MRRDPMWNDRAVVSIAKEGPEPPPQGASSFPSRLVPRGRNQSEQMREASEECRGWLCKRGWAEGRRTQLLTGSALCPPLSPLGTGRALPGQEVEGGIPPEPLTHCVTWVGCHQPQFPCW